MLADSQRMQASDSKEVLIKVENVSKKFSRSLKASLRYGVLDMLSELNPARLSAGKPDHERSLSPLRKSEFIANEGISFEVHRGECLGLIGHNGAGKTTLLKMLNGLIKPDSGRIEMRGRVGALIALSAGFNPVLTGRENVFVNGSILGFSRKEMREKFDEIVEFSEIGDAIDAPVRTYSSGMQTRLGFSVAINLNPDILLIDEVLAVGDAGFRAKCMRAIHQVMKRVAVIFVSHSMSQVTALCSHIALMNKGRVIRYGTDLAEIAADYFAEFGECDFIKNEVGSAVVDKVRVNRMETSLLNEARLEWGDPLELEIDVKSDKPLKDLVVNLIVSNRENVGVLASFADPVDVGVGITRVRFRIPDLYLAQGPYSCRIGLNQVHPGEKPILHATYAGVGKFRMDCENSYAIQSGAIFHLPGDWTMEAVG